MNKLALLALQKWTENELENFQPAVGDNEVQETLVLDISAIIRKAEASTRIPTVSIPTKEVLALFVEKCGIVREHALNLLKSCMVEALSENKDTKATIQNALKNFKQAEDSVKSTLSALPKQLVAGKTTFPALNVKVVEQDTNKQVAAVL